LSAAAAFRECLFALRICVVALPFRLCGGVLVVLELLARGREGAFEFLVFLVDECALLFDEIAVGVERGDESGDAVIGECAEGKDEEPGHDQGSTCDCAPCEAEEDFGEDEE
jgi:hypothetical protein